jgi:hypothetical protein
MCVCVWVCGMSVCVHMCVCVCVGVCACVCVCVVLMLSCMMWRCRAQQLTGAAPLNSLTARLVLNCLVAGNPRAVAALWHQFAKALWSGHWHGDADFPLDDDDEVEPLPRMPSQDELREADGSWQQPDLRTCLLHQKLHLLQVATSSCS